jgi:bifunctional DNA-binding transcriptional regulator/antitoxin component of YhaV-PrlF toxin-antitoxin module
MISKKVELLTKVGPKGQIVIRKDIREIRIKPLDKKEIKKEIEGVARIARIVSKHWPKGVSAVDAIREERK